MKMSKLKWISSTTAMPSHDQLVLLKCDDGYHVATFNCHEEGFKLGGGAFLTSKDCNIHWVAITPP
jgi:hypothetical protein